MLSQSSIWHSDKLIRFRLSMYEGVQNPWLWLSMTIYWMFWSSTAVPKFQDLAFLEGASMKFSTWNLAPSSAFCLTYTVSQIQATNERYFGYPSLSVSMSYHELHGGIVVKKPEDWLHYWNSTQVCKTWLAQRSPGPRVRSSYPNDINTWACHPLCYTCICDKETNFQFLRSKLNLTVEQPYSASQANIVKSNTHIWTNRIIDTSTFSN